MFKQYKDFVELQREVREELSPLLRIAEVRSIIGCGSDFILELIREGEIDAVDITGRSVDKNTINAASRGLRIPPSSLKDFLDRNTIK